MKKYQTLVIEYEGEVPPFTGFGEKIAGCEIVTMSTCNEIYRGEKLEEKIEELEGLICEIGEVND